MLATEVAVCSLSSVRRQHPDYRREGIVLPAEEHHRGHLELVALMLDDGFAEKARGADGLNHGSRVVRSLMTRGV